MEFKFKNIGISGVAGAGKNTLAELIGLFLTRMGLPVEEKALAHNLKSEVRSTCKELYSIDPLTCSRDDKDLIRPILVAHGEIKRKSSLGRHWTGLLEKDLDRNKVNIITDIRYNEYPQDECYWLKNQINGILIHVSRYQEVGEERVFVKPANIHELQNDSKVRKDSDYILNWKTEKDQNRLVINSKSLFKWLKKVYK